VPTESTEGSRQFDEYFIENDGCRGLWESTIYMNILAASSPCTSSIRGTPSLYESGLEHTVFLADPNNDSADVPTCRGCHRGMSRRLCWDPNDSAEVNHADCTTEGRHWWTDRGSEKCAEIQLTLQEGSHAASILLSWPHHHQATMFSLNIVSLSLTQSVPRYKTFDFFISSLTTHLIQNWCKYHLFSQGFVY